MVEMACISRLRRLVAVAAGAAVGSMGGDGGAEPAAAQYS